MTDTYKTPGVYIKEISVFPPSVAEVESAVPAFIGYTQKARRSKDGDLNLKPTAIYSFTEFEQFFGLPKNDTINVDLKSNTVGGYDATVTAPDVKYLLYYAVKMYFDNGGGKCFIVSVKTYSDSVAQTDLMKGLTAIKSEDEPTLLVVPEAAGLNATDYKTICQEMLSQCGELGDRFAILDVSKTNGSVSPTAEVLTSIREGFDSHLCYGAVYYPFVVSAMNYFVDQEESNVTVKIDTSTPGVTLKSLATSDTTAYNAAKLALRGQFVVMPPSGAVAGVYAATDTARGVWKSPANVALSNVIEPSVRITDLMQGDLNVDASTGKSINVIRAFAGKGTLVWGARTLAGNDNEWRYVSVRRFFNMVEESVKKATAFAVFEPNDANTWVKVRGMIENYLTQKWREGALAGATTKDAFFVRCGLGVTMNSLDILEGRMNVEIGMAVVRPAEFIILKFSHKLQTS